MAQETLRDVFPPAPAFTPCPTLLIAMSATSSRSLHYLRMASLAEGATLLVLLLVAVPLKRMADVPMAVSVMGTIHGLAFLIYSAMVLQALFTRLITPFETARLMVAAFIPFGAFMLSGLFRRKMQVVVQSR